MPKEQGRVSQRLLVLADLLPDSLRRAFRAVSRRARWQGGIVRRAFAVKGDKNGQRLAKRLLDVIFAACFLIVASPLVLVIALVVKLTSPGPVLYRQERMSLNGHRFQMLKFRSMPVDAESRTGPVWASPGEDRATPIGRFLRRTSLDELPQFLNVLRGDMSIVGPRPERPVFVEEFRNRVPHYMLRHNVRAGITGWAQVNGWRGNTSIDKRIECDLYYIQNWSLGLDLKIMWLTLWKGFIHEHAY